MTRKAEHPPIAEIMLSCMRHGWSVFPLEPREKLPHGRLLPQTFDQETGKDRATWLHYRAAAPSSRDIERWHSEDPAMNYAIVTGRVSGLLVADADGPGAVAWMEEQGAIQTPISSTSPGKRHYLFAYPADGGRPFTNRTKLLSFEDGSQLDIRAEGGYIVGPGSIHPSGSRYQWLITPDDASPAPVPAFLMELLRPADQSAAPTVTTSTTRREDLSDRAANRRAAWVEAAINEELATLRSASEGARNATTFKVTRRLFSFVNSEDVRESDIERDIRNAASGYIAAAGEREFLSTYNSGRRWGITELPNFPDFEESTGEAEPQLKVLTDPAPSPSGDGATALIETVWGILTANPKVTGWTGTIKLLGIFSEVAQYRAGGQPVVFEGGAAAVADILGISAPTVGTHVERMESVGLADWKKGKPVLCDKKGRPVERCEVDPARSVKAQGYHWQHSEAVLVLKSLPSGKRLPTLPRTERQEKQAKREEAKREEAAQNVHDLHKLREKVEEIEAARCPHCHDIGTLSAHCTGCGAIVTASGLAEMTGADPDVEATQEQPIKTFNRPSDPAQAPDPVKTFNSYKQGKKLLTGTPATATAGLHIGAGRKGAGNVELPLWPEQATALEEAPARPAEDDQGYRINHGAHMHPPRPSPATAAD